MKPNLKRVIDRVAALLVRPFFFVLAWLPRPVSRFLCRSIAASVFALDAGHRRIGMINLGIAFPEKDQAWRRKTLRESFLQLGDLAVELSRLHRLTSREVLRRVRFDHGYGLEHYREARSEGRGVLFLTAHVGAWELLPAAQALYGHPLSFLVRPLDNPFLEAWLASRRSACGNEVISKHQGLRKVLKRLKQGGDVGFLIDQNVQPKDGIYAPFFGHQASTSSALAAVALKSGAPVVAGFIRPGPSPGHHLIRFHPPIHLRPSGDHRKDLVEGTTLFNQAIEDAIRDCPSAWLWGHRRFQSQPGGRDPYRE